VSISQAEIAYEVKINWEEIINPNKSMGPYEVFYFSIFRDSLLKDQTLKLLYANGDESELELWQKYAKEFKLSVSDFYLSKKDFKRLEKLEIVYLAKKDKVTQKHVREKYMPVWNLEFSPAEFRPRKPRWAKYGYAYIRHVEREE